MIRGSFFRWVMGLLVLLLGGCTSTSAPIEALTPSPVPRVTPTPFEGPLPLTLQPLASDLRQPLGIVNAGDGSGRLFILEKTGRILIVRDGMVQPQPFLDISTRVSRQWERGLLGLAFEPGRPERFYLNYTDLEGNTVIARYRTGATPDEGDPASEEVLLRVEQPAANHNGGNLVFGPDGYLWIGLGDGGKANDVYGHGQNPHTLLASMLRLDVSGESDHRIPPDNPFADGEDGSPAIWAIGLRNPWRFSFDRQTGDLWLADVGQHRWEEINHVPSDQPGLNFGWSITEGRHCFGEGPCETEGLVVPVAEYSHDEGCSVTGGYVYRGRAIPALVGHYLFGDFCTGRIWMIPADGEPPLTPTLLLETGLPITSFGEDERGELYVATYKGELFALVSE